MIIQITENFSVDGEPTTIGMIIDGERIFSILNELGVSSAVEFTVISICKKAKEPCKIEWFSNYNGSMKKVKEVVYG